MTPWDQVCERGWAKAYNADYVQVHRADGKIRCAKWTRKGSEKPWHVVFVCPGEPWSARQHKRFKSFKKAMAFINKRGA